MTQVGLGPGLIQSNPRLVGFSLSFCRSVGLRVSVSAPEWNQMDWVPRGVGSDHMVPSQSQRENTVRQGENSPELWKGRVRGARRFRQSSMEVLPGRERGG